MKQGFWKVALSTINILLALTLFDVRGADVSTSGAFEELALAAVFAIGMTCSLVVIWSYEDMPALRWISILFNVLFLAGEVIVFGISGLFRQGAAGAIVFLLPILAIPIGNILLLWLRRHRKKLEATDSTVIVVVKWVGFIGVTVVLGLVFRSTIDVPLQQPDGRIPLAFLMMLTIAAIWARPGRIILRTVMSALWVAVWFFWWFDYLRGDWLTDSAALIIGIPVLAVQSIWIGTDRLVGKYARLLVLEGPSDVKTEVRTPSPLTSVGAESLKPQQSDNETPRETTAGQHLGVQPDSAELICRTCGKRCASDFSFCPFCGQSAMDKLCVVCSKLFDRGFRYCPHCGHPS